MKRSASTRLDDAVAEAAILWMVRLQSGEVSLAERQAFENWQAADPRHGVAFERLAAGLAAARQSPWQGRPSGPMLQALEAPSSRRSFMRNSLALGGLALSVGLLARASLLPWSLPGDLQTGTAQRRDWQLADGSRLQLNARSRVATAFSSQHRELRLYQGELVLDLAANPTPPFHLRSEQGVVSASSGRLLLRQQGESTRLITLSGSARLTPANGRQQLIEPRRSVLFDQTSILQQAAMSHGETAWLDGWIEARNEPLAQIIETMRAYRRGIMRLDARLANLAVSGLYPLDNSDQTLEMLQQQLPIRVTRYSPYWIEIERA